jgi:hypothetical protein
MIPHLNIYCINLDRRTDRWAHIQSQLKGSVIEGDVERFTAIEAECGIVGCRESHFDLIRKAKSEGLHWVGIMEDDCAFYPHFASEYPKMLASIWNHRDKWDIFNSGPIGVNYMIRIDNQLIRIDNCMCTQFIIINSSAYDKILNSYIPGESEGGVDLYYRDVCKERVVTWAPLLSYQIISKSDVQSGYTIGETDEFQKAYKKFLSFLPIATNLSCAQ